MLYDKIELENEETVSRTARKHWFIIYTELALVILFALLPLFSMMFLLATPLSENLRELFLNNSSFIIFSLALWLLLSSLAAMTVWTNYFLDLWVVTDRRIIVIEQNGFFNRKIGNFRLERLQDIQVTINGVIATLLDFGTITAQTAGATSNNFESQFLPHPRELQAIIQTAMDSRLKTIYGETAGLTE